MKLKIAQPELADAYANIVDRLLVSLQGQVGQRWLVVAASEDDGSTSGALGLARALALRREKVLLMDANLRDRELSGVLGASEKPGLIQVLRQGLALANVCRQERALGAFTAVGAGTGQVEPTDLWSQPRVREVLAQLASQFNHTLIDVPALDRGQDALQLAPMVDGCLLVVQAGKTRRQAVEKARAQIEQAGGKIVGVVLNRYRQWLPQFESSKS